MSQMKTIEMFGGGMNGLDSVYGSYFQLFLEFYKRGLSCWCEGLYCS